MAFSYGVGKINIFKVLLGKLGGVTKKSTLCTLLIMLTIMDDPLTNKSFAICLCFVYVCPSHLTHLSDSSHMTGHLARDPD